MPFVDVIDNYTNGATGTLTTSDGGSVGYTVLGNATTDSRPNTDQGALVTADSSQSVRVDFDEIVHGMTISVDRSNPGEVYYFVVDGVQIDLNAAIASGDVIFTQTGAQTQVISADGGITGTGTFDDGSLAFLHFQSPVQTIQIYGTGATASDFDLFEIGIDSDDFRIVCFAEGTMIRTPDGPRDVADLQKGDLVCLYDSAPRPVVAVEDRKVTRRCLHDEPRFAPILIRKDALAPGYPSRDLRVSRQHRILIASRAAKRIFGATEVLIPAIHLVGLPGIEIDRRATAVTYYHVLLDDHAIILANDAPAETLYMGPMARKAVGADIVPFEDDANTDVGNTRMTPARPLLDARMSKRIIAAHLRHDRPLLEVRDGAKV